MNITYYKSLSRIAASVIVVAVPLAAASSGGACHGPDGSGSTPVGKQMKVKDLRSAEVQKQTDAELTAIVTGGKSPMPAFGKALAPPDIAGVVAFLRTIASKS